MARLVQALPSLAQAWARRGPSGGALSGFDEPLLAKGLELGVYWEVEGDVPAMGSQFAAEPKRRGESTWSFTATSISVLKSEHTATKCYTTSANPDLWKKGGVA